jgi:hypothetical protein
MAGHAIAYLHQIRAACDVVIRIAAFIGNAAGTGE